VTYCFDDEGHGKQEVGPKKSPPRDFSLKETRDIVLLQDCMSNVSVAIKEGTDFFLDMEDVGITFADHNEPYLCDLGKDKLVSNPKHENDRPDAVARRKK
jgi:hypothetical protein